MDVGTRREEGIRCIERPSDVHQLPHTLFDSSQKLTLACDALGYGLGAVLAHKMPHGSEKPIGYASPTLTQAERNYS